MSKKLVTLISIIAVVAILLCGCESYRFDAGFSDLPSVDDLVENNGGLAVKQGKYVYFINAQSDYDYEESGENYFNGKDNLLKGAIYRGTIADNRLTQISVVVPKNAMTSYTDGGLYVFGSWIYYTSSNVASDSNGSVKAEEIVFYRTSIDGKKTQKLCVLESNSTPYMITSTCIYYYADSTLYRVDTTASRRFSAEVCVEEVSSYIFADHTSYNPKNNTIAECVFYTKASEDDTSNGNVLYALDNKGESHVLINEATFCDDANSVAALKNIYKVTPVSSLNTTEGVVLYYTKSNYVNGATNDVGLYSLAINSADYTVSPKTEEKQLVSVAQSTIYPVSATEVYYYSSNIVYRAVYGSAVEVYKDFSADITIKSFDFDGGYIYYLNSSSALFRYPISKQGNAESVLKENLSTSWLKPALIDNMLIYTNSGDLNYTYCVYLDTLSDKEPSNVLLGVKTIDDEE